MNNTTALEDEYIIQNSTTYNQSFSAFPPNSVTGELTTKQIILIIVLGLITIVTILGNGVVLFVFFTAKKKLNSASHLLLANMAIADLLVGIVVMPVLASVTILNRQWIFGEIMCSAWDYVHFTLCATSMLSMVGMSLERYIGVRYPLKHIYIATSKRTKSMIILIWTLSCALIIFPSIYWPNIQPVPEICQMNANFHFLLFITTVVYWIPITCTIITYYLIYRNAVRPFSHETPSGTIGSKNIGNDQFVAAREKQTRLSKRIACITGLLVLFYFPMFGLFSIVALEPILLMDIVEWVILAAWIRYSCSMVNPFMYALAVPGYTQAIRERYSVLAKILT